MALIKWKQISGQLGDYGNLTGSLNISGGLSINGEDVGATATTASHALFAVSASYAISASVEILTEVSSSHAEIADSASFISDLFISQSAVRSGFGGGVDSSIFNGNRIISQQLFRLQIL